GSEANELALRLARTATGRPDVAVVDVAYHGNTQRLVEVSPYKFDGPGGSGKPDDVQVVPLPDPYRGAHRGMTTSTADAYLAAARDVIAAADAAGHPAGAVIAAPIASLAGQVVRPPGSVAGLFDAAGAGRAVPVGDGVRAGCGRGGRAAGAC